MSQSRAAVVIPTGTPQPQPIRFFGTSWVRHDGGYRWRRIAASLGSLLGAVAGTFALRYGIQGLARISTSLTLVGLGGFTVSGVLAFRRTWLGFTRRDPDADPDAEKSTSSLYAIGFVGALLAYFLRSLTEAPGERLHRAEYEEARVQHARRRSARSGNPAADPHTFL
ncbi:hypothetical protein ACFO3J_35840 [Streptomyces polygonati]|uniref:Transmembrane protein n=1 Tax=Streptomyces polygonati TaxID=1617087 RepID=A0ABV8HXH8_9ACTN